MERLSTYHTHELQTFKNSPFVGPPHTDKI